MTSARAAGQLRLALGLTIAFLGVAGVTWLLRTSDLNSVMAPAYGPRHAVYMAHPWLLWTNVGSDLLTACSYSILFISLCWIFPRLKRVGELRNHLWISSVFMILLAASGTTNVIRVITVWWPLYQVSILLKVVCALAIVPTALFFAYRAPAIAANVGRFFDLLAIVQQQADRLRKNEEFLERTGKLAGVGGWEVNLETKQVTWSDEVCRIHGAEPGYKPTLEEGLRMYTPEAQPVIAAAVQNAIAGGSGWELELPLIRFDGQRVWTRSVGTVEFKDGKPVRLSGAFQDVTAIVEAREALQLANERVALATDSGGIGIWDWDIEKGTLSCDPWMYRLHGKDPAKPRPASDLWRDHLHPDDKASVEQALERALQGVENFDAEFRLFWEDGSLHTLRGSARVQRDAHGRALHMIGANWDVTESRRLMAQLAEEHERLRVTLQSIGDGVITTDATGHVLWLNPVAERMTGWSVENALGQPLHSVYRTFDEHTRSMTGTVLPTCNSTATAEAMQQQLLLISRGGSEFGIESSASPICNGYGELLGTVLVFRDVTEQRRLHAEAERAIKLQLRLKDEFLSHVSHELRSPLTSIYSFTSIIADGLAGETSEQQQEYFRIILKNVEQLQSMIEDLLAVTQLREGKLSIDLQPASVHNAIVDAMHTVQAAAAGKRISLFPENFASLPAAYADPTRLRQVLIILLDNAVKFTPYEGAVTIRAAEHENDQIMIEVIDNGCGIPADKWLQVFDNLYQIADTNQADPWHTGRTGLGLGLHIAKDLVTKQGGAIWVTSVPGEGSTFSFTLPMFSGSGTAAMAADDERTSCR